MPGPAFDQKVKQVMAELDQREMQLNVEQRKIALLRRERELDQQRKSINERFADKKPGRRGLLQSLKDVGLPVNLLPYVIMVKLLALTALCCAILHLLFTVVVFRDMQKRGTMNGLWIPIVVIGGVCGVVAYALMKEGPGRERG